MTERDKLQIEYSVALAKVINSKNLLFHGNMLMLDAMKQLIENEQEFAVIAKKLNISEQIDNVEKMVNKN